MATNLKSDLPTTEEVEIIPKDKDVVIPAFEREPNQPEGKVIRQVSQNLC